MASQHEFKSDVSSAVPVAPTATVAPTAPVVPAVTTVAYRRDFGSHEIRKLDEIRVSNYGFEGAARALDVLGLPNNFLIVQPVYADYTEGGAAEQGQGQETSQEADGGTQVIADKKVPGDAQLFVTAVNKPFETASQATPVSVAIRRLREEIRFEPSDTAAPDMKLVYSFTSSFHTVSWVGCPIEGLKFTPDADPIERCKRTKADKEHKAVGVVYGPKDAVLKAMMSFNAGSYPGDDNVAGLVAMRVADVKTLISCLNFGKNRDISKTTVTREYLGQ